MRPTTSTGTRYGDETWRLAARRDADALRRAAALLADYDAHRARAFALAVERRSDEALAELAAGRVDGWPFEPAALLDGARVHHLAGDDGRALDTIAAATRAAPVPDPAAGELAAEIARASRHLRGRALALVLARGTLRQRARNAVGVLRGW